MVNVHKEVQRVERMIIKTRCSNIEVPWDAERSGRLCGRDPDWFA